MATKFQKTGLLAILLALASCTQTNPGLVGADQPLVWPPESTGNRIQFLSEITQPRNIRSSKGQLSRIFSMIVGTRTVTLTAPRNVTKDRDGFLYILDSNGIVHVIDEISGKYHWFPETRTNNYLNPVNIASAKDRIYISDSQSAVVHVFEEQGRSYLKSFGDGLFSRPTGIAYHPVTNELLILDTKDSVLFVFDADTLALKKVIGGDNQPPVFHFPTNIIVGADDNIYISDSLNFKIQVLDASLNLQSSFGDPGIVPGSFSRPKGLATDSEDHVYVVDALFDNIQIFEPDGTLLLAFGGPGNGPGQFWLPSAIFIDRNDKIYVADQYNRRVQVFQYIKGSDQ